MSLFWPLGDKALFPIGPIIGGVNYGTEDEHLARGEDIAIDIPASAGTPIYACHDARVSLARWAGDAGYAVWLSWIEDGHRWQSRDCPMPGIEVDAGQDVVAGPRIGAVGSTGKSTGPHDHHVLFCDHARVRPSDIYFPAPQEDDMTQEQKNQVTAHMDELWRVKGALEGVGRINRRDLAYRLSVVVDGVKTATGLQ